MLFDRCIQTILYARSVVVPSCKTRRWTRNRPGDCPRVSGGHVWPATGKSTATQVKWFLHHPNDKIQSPSNSKMFFLCLFWNRLHTSAIYESIYRLQRQTKKTGTPSSWVETQGTFLRCLVWQGGVARSKPTLLRVYSTKFHLPLIINHHCIWKWQLSSISSTWCLSLRESQVRIAGKLGYFLIGTVPQLFELRWINSPPIVNVATWPNLALHFGLSISDNGALSLPTRTITPNSVSSVKTAMCHFAIV